MTRSLQLKDLGEAKVLQLLQEFCPAAMIGDDGAVLALEGRYSLVVTTDVLVETVHFSDRTTPPEAVGWRAVAANLSDLAAMGAMPIGITVGLCLPPTTRLDWLIALYQGVADCLETYHTPLIGGDLTRSPTGTVSITALGQVLPQKVISRRAAKVGDAIFVTGYHGDSRAGLELLLHPEQGEHLSSVIRQNLIKAHQKPHPRLDVLDALTQLTPERAIAGMDSSDGLADAVLQIAEMSQVGAVILEDSIPLSPALLQYRDRKTALQWSLYGGEDFQLVLCLPRQYAQALSQHCGEGSGIVGYITAESGVKMVTSAGSEVLLSRSPGFQHF